AHLLQHLSALYVPDKLSSLQHTVPQRHRLGAVSCSYTTQAGLKTTIRTFAFAAKTSVSNASVTAPLFFRVPPFACNATITTTVESGLRPHTTTPLKQKTHETIHSDTLGHHEAHPAYILSL
ncbi:unnamed protein product, partial [Ectocarpus sp. 8 AP-2014]